MKKLLYSLILLGLILMLGAPGVAAKSYFRGDTLLVHVDQLKLEEFDSIRYAFSPPAVRHVLKVNYEDNPRFADKDFDDRAWKTDSNSYIANKEALKVIWYRFKLHIDSAMLAKPFFMHFVAEGALELYIDGALTAKIGAVTGTEKDTYYYLKEKPVMLSFTDTGYHQVAIRFKSSVTKADGTAAWFLIRIEDPLSHMHQLKFGGIYSGIIFLSLGTLFFALFLVHCLFFLFYKKEKANLIFAIFTFSIALCLISGYGYFNAVSMRFDNFYIFTISFIPIISCFSLCAFISYVFSKSRKILIIIAILCGLSLILAAVDAYGASQLLSGVFIWILLIGSLIYTSIMIIVAMVKRVPGSLILGSGVLYFLLFALVLLIFVLINGAINFDTALSYFTLSAILGIPLSISAYLAWRFSTTSRALSKELENVAALSTEKQHILEHQNEKLEFQVSERTKELKAEKQKSDDLLLNILPQEVAEELKEKGESKAQYYDEVSVLFTDFVNFTATAEQLGVDELLAELNVNFTAFDQIMEKHGLEKIKTIGDAYLAVSGLPVKNADHALNAVAAALDILAFVEARKKEVPYGLDIRIGIHSGSLIAGIVGVKKFAFDIWGDTVNTAARMEQSSAPGKVNISESTQLLVKEAYTCVYRGKLQVKGKGEMDMYFVDSK